MKETDVLLFTGELADLLEAGMTLGQALSALANQGDEGSPQRLVCKDLTDRIVNGEAFSEAVKHHPKTFQPLYGNMIKAGESSGALFEKVFASMGGSLPLPTRILIGMSDAVIGYGWLMAACVVGLVMWFRKWKSTPDGRLKFDSLKLKTPLIKNIVANGIYASLAFTLKTLLANGVNVLNALRIAEETCGNAVIGAALANARKRVTDGTSISGPLAQSGAFPRMMTDMLAVGERAGNMTASLEHIGMRYEKDMNRSISAFTTALEPILIVGVAVVLGFVVLAILMAVFGMVNAIG